MDKTEKDYRIREFSMFKLNLIQEYYDEISRLNEMGLVNTIDWDFWDWCNDMDNWIIDNTDGFITTIYYDMIKRYEVEWNGI